MGVTMNRLILTSFAIILTAFIASGCGPQVNSTTRTRLIQRPAQTTGAPQQIESQAQNLGINVNWEETLVLSDEGDRLNLEHTFSINGQKQKLQTMVTLGLGSCDKASQISYDAYMGQTLSNSVYSALGVSTCWVGHNLHIGLSVMGWNNQGLTQQFVFVNLDQGSIRSIQKGITQPNQWGYLPDWIAQQF
jgi:hypothetical protein